jgi:hypothetical protein
MVGTEALCAAKSGLGMTAIKTSPIVLTIQRIGVIDMLLGDEQEHNRSIWNWERVPNLGEVQQEIRGKPSR